MKIYSQLLGSVRPSWRVTQTNPNASRDSIRSAPSLPTSRSLRRFRHQVPSLKLIPASAPHGYDRRMSISGLNFVREEAAGAASPR